MQVTSMNASARAPRHAAGLRLKEKSGPMLGLHLLIAVLVAVLVVGMACIVVAVLR
jgi:hypothetical protein